MSTVRDNHAPAPALADAPAMLPLQTRLMPVAGRDAVNTEARTVRVCFTTGATVRRARWVGWDGIVPFDEVLTVSRDAVDLSRLNSGAPALESHSTYSTYSQVGVIERAWIEQGHGWAEIRFPKAGVDERADRLFSLVDDGIIRNVSVGYVINEVRVVEAEKKGDVEQRIITNWTPYEISFVTVPADKDAQVRSGDEPLFPLVFHRAIAHNQEGLMEGQNAPGATPENIETRAAPAAPVAAVPPAPAAPAAPDAAVVTRAQERELGDLAQRFAFDSAELRRLIDTGATAADISSRMLQHAAQRQAQTPAITPRVEVMRDGQETQRAAITDALSIRLGSGETPNEAARQFVNYSLAEIAAEFIGYRGALRTVADREALMTRAFHTTSDLPNVFQNAMNKSLLARYEVAPVTYRLWAQRRSFRDFRPHNVVRIGDFPMLQAISERGEIRSGTVSESKETISVASYAVQLRITRQMLVNDDLNAIAQLLAAYGDTIARFEERLAYTEFAANKSLATDNVAMFHASHNNLAAAGTAITVAAVGAARAAMRKQVSLDKLALNVEGRYLIVGPDKETEADTLLAQIIPRNQGDVNPFSGKLEKIVSAEVAGNQWTIAADPARVPNFQWGLLDGYEAPRVRFDEPFGVQGMAMSVEHDFGVGGVDFRGMYRNPGA